MIHLRKIFLDPDKPRPDGFPFTVPVIRTLESLSFTTPVTFFVGENGSGKSTVLEAIASAAQLPTVGSDSTDQDVTLDAVRQLANLLKWEWNKRTRSGFFMRSEDFFGYAKRIATEMAELRRNIEEDSGHKGQSAFAKRLSKLPYNNEYHALRNSYGEGLDVQSHGESYFKLFQSRFRAGGLYLMDEPEAPLSPNRQLAFLAMVKQMVAQDAQFIIATHSPIILAYPDATIYNFEDGKIVQTAYDELEHVIITREFLNNPQVYLKHLME